MAIIVVIWVSLGLIESEVRVLTDLKVVEDRSREHIEKSWHKVSDDSETYHNSQTATACRTEAMFLFIAQLYWV